MLPFQLRSFDLHLNPFHLQLNCPSISLFSLLLHQYCLCSDGFSFMGFRTRHTQPWGLSFSGFHRFRLGMIPFLVYFFSHLVMVKFGSINDKIFQSYHVSLCPGGWVSQSLKTLRYFLQEASSKSSYLSQHAQERVINLCLLNSYLNNISKILKTFI